MKGKTIYWIVGILVVFRVYYYIRIKNCKRSSGLGNMCKEWQDNFTLVGKVLGLGKCKECLLDTVQTDSYLNIDI